MTVSWIGSEPGTEIWGGVSFPPECTTNVAGTRTLLEPLTPLLVVELAVEVEALAAPVVVADGLLLFALVVDAVVAELER
jgi:hypothetical protein